MRGRCATVRRPLKISPPLLKFLDPPLLRTDMALPLTTTSSATFLQIDGPEAHNILDIIPAHSRVLIIHLHSNSRILSILLNRKSSTIYVVIDFALN